MARNTKCKKHGRHFSRGTIRNFTSLALLSLAFVSGVAVLSRAELRLSGEILAANPDELQFLFNLDPPPTVERIANREEVKLYLLTQEEKQHLVHVEPVEGEWKITKVEKVRR